MQVIIISRTPFYFFQTEKKDSRFTFDIYTILE